MYSKLIYKNINHLLEREENKIIAIQNELATIKNKYDSIENQWRGTNGDI